MRKEEQGSTPGHSCVAVGGSVTLKEKDYLAEIRGPQRKQREEMMREDDERHPLGASIQPHLKTN